MDELLHASVMLTVVGRAPLLAKPYLARAICAALNGCALEAPGRLWGYVVLPDSVRLVLGPCEGVALQRFVAQVKAETAARALSLIRRSADTDALDAVLRFNPVWGGALYRLWQAGFHCTWLHDMAQVGRALQGLVEAPLRAGLAAPGNEWPYCHLFL